MYQIELTQEERLILQMSLLDTIEKVNKHRALVKKVLGKENNDDCIEKLLEKITHASPIPTRP